MGDISRDIVVRDTVRDTSDWGHGGGRHHGGHQYGHHGEGHIRQVTGCGVGDGVPGQVTG